MSARSYKHMIEKLRHSGAPDALVEQFRRLYEVYGADPRHMLSDLVSVCSAHNWTAIFETDGIERHVRPMFLPADHADSCSDTIATNPPEEQAYRRGYEQGFAAALQVIATGGQAEAERTLDRVHAWRTRSIRALGSPPGAEEPLSHALPLRRAGLSPSRRHSILSRDGFRCQHCGASTSDGEHVRLEVDHIDPVANGGDDADDNLQTLCWECNRGKGGQPL